MVKNIVVIVGPTASGKTDISIKLAWQNNGEIVSADSRQIYKYMDIGTAKPTPEQLQLVQHHCVNIKEPDEFFNAGKYGKLSREIIDDILRRKKLPVVAGGSGLYIRAIIDGIFEGEFTDMVIRRQLKKELSENGNQSLYSRLKKVDPITAEKIHPHDSRRIIRALEVYKLSGEPISSLQNRYTKKPNFTPLLFGLQWPRKVLYKRIETRVDKMIKNGFIFEVENLLKMGYGPELNSLDSLGYREIISYLKGRIEYCKMIEEIKKNTRRFAKKQLTWFRKDTRIEWIDMNACTDSQEVVDKIVEYFFSRKRIKK
ncbi:MAG: tRNA (adenosine(37)-N6)-dimethylallyltransferase MiaA [bacterium]